MQHLMSLAGSWAGKLPVRPLLYAAGAAGTVAGIYYYIKKRGDGERTGATTPTQDPVQTASVDISSLDPSLMMSDVEGVSITHTDSSGPEDSLAEAKRRYEQAMETNTQLENKNSYLMSKVNTLRDSVQQLNEELSLTWIRCNEIMREREQEQEAHRILKSQCKEMKETLKQCDELLQVCEREVEAHIILKVSLAEVERKYKQAIESNAKLENEKSDLMSKVDKLQSSVQEISNMLSEMHNKCSEATRNYEIAQGILKFVKSNAEEREKIFNQEKQSLTTSLAEVEREYQEILTTNAELLVEQTNLIADVNTLQDSLHDLEEELSETTRRRNEIMRECEQKNQELRILGTKWNLMNATILKDYEEELKAHGNLKLQYNEKKEQHDDLLKEREREQVSLAEAERKYKEAMESNAQLENEKSDLLSQVNTLRASVQQLKEKLSETCMKRDEIREREQEKEAHSILKLQYNPKTLKHNKQLLMVSLAEAVRKYEEAKESNAKLENEKFNLKYHVHILRGSMQELEEMLLDAEMKYDAIKQEREQEREAHNILKMQYKKMKETLTQCNELLMNHCIDLGSEEYAPIHYMNPR